jgi:hypothetical protein
LPKGELVECNTRHPELVEGSKDRAAVETGRVIDGF